tara:strand:+ start:2197 stop:2355 length:159 start_codon:yes stop_codon:yes gene_type:complete
MYNFSLLNFSIFSLVTLIVAIAPALVQSVQVLNSIGDTDGVLHIPVIAEQIV